MLMFSTPAEVAVELCKRLRAQRLFKNLSQAELAARANVSVSTVRAIERRAQASLESLLQVVSALGLTGELDSLFKLRITSIADMEKAQVATRQRAPRQRSLR